MADDSRPMNYTFLRLFRIFILCPAVAPLSAKGDRRVPQYILAGQYLVNNVNNPALTLDASRSLYSRCARARDERGGHVFPIGHVHRDWPVNVSVNVRRPESAINHGIDPFPSTKGREKIHYRNDSTRAFASRCRLRGSVSRSCVASYAQSWTKMRSRVIRASPTASGFQGSFESA